MPAQAGPLLEQIRRDAAASAEARVTTARAEAERTRSEARERSGRNRALALAARERALAGALDAARAEASQRVSRETLASRAAALDRIFTAAAALLQTLAADPRLGAALGKVIADALTYLPDGPATVRAPAPVVAAVRGILTASGRDAVAVRVDDSVALGAIVESTDGAVAIDVTFARQLERARKRLSIAIMRKLEPAPT
ncbi:MAG: V-type ATP synthase subunit E family protein [Gemmatimonadales bacterium]